MTIELRTPTIAELGDVIGTLCGWQREGAPIQLHPGDLGWSWRHGAGHVASTVRTWNRGDDVLAIGYLDGPEVVRLTVSPEMWADEDLARRVVADVCDPAGSTMPAAKVAAEVPDGTCVKELLSARGWAEGEAWIPLRLDLGSPVADPELWVEVVATVAQVAECTSVHQSAWNTARFTEQRWHAMAAGPAFAEARCLLARDVHGVAVATLTAWSAGPGRPGLIEPLGVHVDHRRRGYGAMLCRAAGAHLRALGSTSVLVCTPSELHGAVATYEAAGYQRLAPRRDLCRQ